MPPQDIPSLYNRLRGIYNIATVVDDLIGQGEGDGGEKPTGRECGWRGKWPRAGLCAYGFRP